MQLFIDTNILVGFYQTSSDSLVELEKIVALLKQQKAVLWLPDQVEKEFWKNREPAIAKQLAEFEKGGALSGIPLLVKEHAQFNQLKEAVSSLEKKRAEIISSLRSDVAKEDTRADRLVRQLFSYAKKVDTSGDIFDEAFDRALRRLPPGKTEGIGDRLCWLALLGSVPEKQDLFIISDDGDYASEADGDEVSSYLRHEWKTKKRSNVTLWKRASKFLAKHVPGAANAIEVERTLLVERLEQSINFSTTHKTIAEFSDLSHLNNSLVERLAQALTTNNQIVYIFSDADVKQFGKDFVALYGKKIEPVVKQKIDELLTH